MSNLVERIRSAIDQDELWALAASKPHHGDAPTVEGGMHWAWGVGDDWDHYEPDPLEEFLGQGVECAGSVTLITKEEWPYSWSPRPSPGAVLTGVEEVRTTDAAHIIRHDPARVLRQVAAHRKTLERHQPVECWAGRDMRPWGGPDLRMLVAVECSYCWDCPRDNDMWDDYHGGAREWPCPDVLDLAEAYEIGVDDSATG